MCPDLRPTLQHVMAPAMLDAGIRLDARFRLNDAVGARFTSEMSEAAKKLLTLYDLGMDDVPLRVPDESESDDDNDCDGYQSKPHSTQPHVNLQGGNALKPGGSTPPRSET